MKKLLLFVAIIVSFASCTKTNSASVANDILRNGKWKITAYTSKYTYMGSDVVTDLYAAFPDCKSDDYLAFSDAFNGTQFTSTKKCGAESDEVPFQWEVKNNNKTLMLNNATYTVGQEYIEATITKINSLSFTISYTQTIQTAPSVAPTVIYYTQTFTRF